MQRSSHGGRGVHGVIEEGYRADLIVENNVELKSVEMLLSVLAPFPRWRALGRIDAGQYGGSSERQKRWPARMQRIRNLHLLRSSLRNTRAKMFSSSSMPKEKLRGLAGREARDLAHEGQSLLPRRRSTWQNDLGW